MAFPEAFIDELIDRNDITDVVGSYVSLTGKGSNLFGLCPFHSEKTPSFSVSPDKQIFYCFGCGKGGGVIRFIMDIENLDYPDAVRYLAKRAGLTVPEDEGYRSNYKRRERLCELNREAAKYFYGQLSELQGQTAVEYFQKRHLSSGTVKRFGLGYAPDSWDDLVNAMTRLGYEKQDLLDAGLAVKAKESGRIYNRFRNRVMFPIIDVRGQVIGFGGRVLDDSLPKYLNSPESIVFNKRKNLFGINIAKKSKQGRIILTEGYMDTIALHQAGFDCAVASLGTSLTDEQANLIAKYTDEAVIAYDSDEAGQAAARRAIGILQKVNISSVKVIRMKGAKDPDEFIALKGRDAFKLLLERSENHIEYRLFSIESQYDLTIDEDKVRYLNEAAALISSLNNAVEREIYGARAAEAAGITPDAFQVEVKKAFQKRIRREKKSQEKKDLAPALELQPKSRSIRYDNIRSAMAEEGLIRLVCAESALFEKTLTLDGELFSSNLLGKAFNLLKQRYEKGLSPSLAALEEQFLPEEMDHLSQIVHNMDKVQNADQLLDDYIDIINTEHAKKAAITEPEALLAMQEMLKGKKGYGG